MKQLFKENIMLNFQNFHSGMYSNITAKMNELIRNEHLYKGSEELENIFLKKIKRPIPESKL